MEEYSSIYHYTSLEVFAKVITNRELWLTSLKSMSDQDEVEYARELVKNSLEELRREEIDFFDTRYLFENSIPSEYCYAMSFSKYSDKSDQWYQYGNEYKGVCIEFDSEVLNNMYGIVSNLPKSLCPYQLNSVIYDIEEQKKLIIEKFKELLCSDKNQIINSAKNVNEAISCLYSTQLEMLLPIIKRSSFSSESEIRLFLSETKVKQMDRVSKLYDCDSIKGNHNDNFNNLLRKLNVTEDKKQCEYVGNSIRSFYKLSLTEVWKRRPIKSVTLGPKNYQQISELELFLRKHNSSNIQIRKSKLRVR